MNLKLHLKNWLPPIVVSQLHSLRRHMKSNRASSQRQFSEWEYCPAGWETNHVLIRGWNEPGVAETYSSKWSRFLDLISGTNPLGVNHEAIVPENVCCDTHNHVMTLAYVVGRILRNRDQLDILDFGGALGHHLAFLQALYPAIQFNYTCCELPYVCEQGRKVFPQVHFHSDESWLGRQYDLVVASNSLQYVRCWQPKLAQLAGVARSSLFITKLPIAKKAPSFVFLQRAWNYGYRTEYMGWCLNQQEFLATALSNNLILRREFLVVAYHPEVANAPEKPQQTGFLFDKK